MHYTVYILTCYWFLLMFLYIKYKNSNSIYKIYKNAYFYDSHQVIVS